MPYVPEEAIKKYQSNPDLSSKDLEGIPNYNGKPASERTARRWRLYLQEEMVDEDEEYTVPEADEITTEEKDNSLCVTSTSDTIKTLEQLLEVSKVDTTLWKVDRWEVKSYQGYRRHEKKDLEFDRGKMSGIIIDDGTLNLTTMYSVKVWLVKREEAPFEEVLEHLLEKLAAPREFPAINKSYPKGNYLLVPGISDVHFARLSLDGTYTPKQTLADLDAVGNAVVARTSGMNMPVDRILLPVGNDVLNADNLQGTTTRGTWQEMSASVRDAVDAACRGYIDLVEKFVNVAPVDIAIIPSNHDRYSIYWLGKVLEAWFANHPLGKYVTVDNRNSPRKYYQYGKTLIGMEHGDRVAAKELALIMANEAKVAWGETKYRIFLRGHFHKEYGMFTPIADTGGVHVVTYPAFCPPDSWELLMGYIETNRAAECRFFHYEEGPAGVFPIFIGELAS